MRFSIGENSIKFFEFPMVMLQYEDDKMDASYDKGYVNDCGCDCWVSECGNL